MLNSVIVATNDSNLPILKERIFYPCHSSKLRSSVKKITLYTQRNFKSVQETLNKKNGRATQLERQDRLYGLKSVRMWVIIYVGTCQK